jgi:vacuolar-type H+-ATPase subunit F/Vma7
MTVGQVVVLGESLAVAGFALGGATTVAADDPDSVRRSWDALPDDTAVVVLTPAAADALGARTGRRAGILTVTMPP